jgi:hypothetical protein
VARAVLGYLNHRFVRLPDTVGITALGLLASLALTIAGRYFPGSVEWAASFEQRLDLPEIVFHGLFSVLLFAGALHINFSELAPAAPAGVRAVDRRRGAPASPARACSTTGPASSST